jgi:DNA mismatch repair ATPase MutS
MYYTEVEETNGSIKMQYRVEEGVMPFSYGIEMAKTLNFPAEFIESAQRMRERLEASVD